MCRDGGLAEKVFTSMQAELEGKDAEELNKARCALIRGMSKFCQVSQACQVWEPPHGVWVQVERAWEMYQRMRTEGQSPDRGTFDSLIRATSFLKDGHEARWLLVEVIF